MPKKPRTTTYRGSYADLFTAIMGKSKTGKTKFVILAIAGDTKTFGVMTQKDYSDWNSGKKWKDKPDIMSLLFGECEAVDTFDNWQGVMQSVLDANGEIVDVETGVAY